MIPAGIRAPFSNPITYIAVALLAVGLGSTSHQAYAQNAAAGAASQAPTGLWLTTPYPEFSAQAGKDVSVPLRLANRGLPPQRVELGIDGLPGGWKWEIDGGGKPVSAAIAGADSTVDLMLKLTPPSGDVGKAVNFAVSGKAATEALQLPMVLTLAKTEPAKLTLEPKLPALRGTAKSAFDFQVDIKNDGQEDSTVNLLSKAPPGFQVTFKQGYGSQELTSLPLKAGESKTLSVSVQPPDNAQAGQYPVAIAASGGNASIDTKLLLDITGRPSISLTGPQGRLSGDATAGQERTFTFTLSNSGSAPARDLKLSASPPSGWKVAFNPEKVDEIAPGATSDVGVSMTPSTKAIAGDYMVSVRANGDGASDSANFRVTVRTSTLWGVAGLGVIGASALMLAFAVTRYGRR
ncbi:NEW3 domain-containing protein [Mesorhizobium sp. VK4C]|uniref:COG1470 family protein n=1 Tax=Mesorhizobium captivum TaxID=3072319 RepID=UPI002A24AE54|nr:NEW3 domain-containing protein [Mesorhizobium sp. VK4C]MDX8500780.1 NEW3 domain-containing protein [Mesorhizobium sp. VK4C]